MIQFALNPIESFLILDEWQQSIKRIYTPLDNPLPLAPLFRFRRFPHPRLMLEVLT